MESKRHAMEQILAIARQHGLTPADIETAFLDPFTADPTVIVICDIFDI